MTVVLTGHDLTVEGLVQVARAGAPVELSPDAVERMRAPRALVDRAARRGDTVYGTTTGVGMRKRFAVAADDGPSFNRALIRDHRVAQGPPAPTDVVRGTMLRLANAFVSGSAGVRPALAERLIRALNENEVPSMRSLGSTGISDLAPLADLAWELFAEVPLEPKEGLALLNAGAYSSSLGALALADADRLADALDVAGALDVEAFGANADALHEAVGQSRPYPGLIESLGRLRSLLDGSFVWKHEARNLQDPLVFRCLPQVNGTLRDALGFAAHQIAIELNASQDNPFPLVAEDRLVSVGNFDLLPLAQALDVARLALAPALTSACERALKLLQAPLTGLPEGLAARSGLAACGLSEFAFSIQALTAEARLLAQPVSYEVVSTTGAEGIEDRITMAPLAGRRLADMVGLGERIVAIELVLAAQAIDLRGSRPLGAGTARTYGLLRERVGFMGEADPIPEDLEPVVDLLRSGAIA